MHTESSVSETNTANAHRHKFWVSNSRDKCALLTLLHTPVELRQDVVQQHVAQRLEILGEDVADGVKCVITGGGHPLGFLRGSKGANEP